MHAYLVNGAMRRQNDTVCNGGFSGFFYAVHRWTCLFKKFISTSETAEIKQWKVDLITSISWIMIDNNDK